MNGPSQAGPLRHQEVITELGQQAIGNENLGQLLQDASKAVTNTLNTDYCAVFEVVSNDDDALLRAGDGWREGLVGAATVPTSRDTQTGYTLVADEPVIVDNLQAESRFSGSELLTRNNVVSGISVTIGDTNGTKGVMCTHTTEEREFTDSEIAFVQSVATILSSAIESQPPHRHHNGSFAQEFQSDLEEILGRISDAFFAVDNEWQFTYLNDRAHELINPDGRQLVGKYVWDEFPEGDNWKFRDKYEHAMRQQEPVSFEEYYPDPLDSWFQVRAYPTETGLSVYFQDITERKERERALEQSEQRYRTLAEYFPNGTVALFDHDLHYTLAAGQAFEEIPVDPSDLEGRHYQEVWPAEIAEALEPAFQAALNGDECSVEVEFANREWVVYAVPITDERENVFAGMMMAQDITEHKEREAELERFRNLIDQSNDAVLVIDPDTGQFLDANETACRRLGYEREDLLELTVPDIEVNLPDLEAWDAHVDNVRTEGSMTFQGEHQRADGTTFPVEVNVNYATSDQGQEYMFAIARDVTQRIEREQALEESERRYRTLAENFPNGTVAVYDSDLRYELVQGAVLGDALPARNQLEGRTIAEVFPKDIVANLDPLLRAAVEDGKTDSDLFKFNERYWQVVATPLRDGNDDIIAGLSFAQDITEQVEREQRLEDTVEKLEERNEHLDSFASMLAHELRNPVTIGQIYSQQLPAETDSEAVEYVTEAFDRIEDMIDIMLVLTQGREAVGERTPVELATVAQEAWDDLDTPQATLEVEINDTIQADQTYIQHFFRNLFENAVEHGGGDVTVTVGDLPTGFYVADNGKGIPVDDRDAVFEAGYTTAAKHGGTGLGLAYVKELAEVYEWEWTVTESDTGGAQFEFRNVTTTPSTTG